MSADRVLDCESAETALYSLSKITGISAYEIERFLITFDMNNYYAMHRNYYHTGDVLLKETFQKKYDYQIRIDETCWFHLSRVDSLDEFNEGIFPLNVSIEHVWNYLYTLVSQEISLKNWAEFQRIIEKEDKSHSAYLYNLKLKDKIHWGPYAMLVKDIAFCADDVGNHDYFKAPEIVEDICNCFLEYSGIDLLERFAYSTKPCYVKFKTNGGKHYYIDIVLFYLYCSLHNEEMSSYCNTCYDNCGEPIKPIDIIDVQFV